MPLIVPVGDGAPPEPDSDPLDLSEVLRLKVGGFLDLTQVLRAQVPAPLVMSHTTALRVPGTFEPPGGGALDLQMSPANVESASFSASVDADTSLDITFLGAPGAGSVSASAGPWGATFGPVPASGEDSGQTDQFGTRTTVHHRIKAPREVPLTVELIPWVEDKDQDSSSGNTSSAPYNAPGTVTRVPPEHRAQLRTDPRWVEVDAVVLTALATVNARLMVVPPFPGYRLTPDNYTDRTKGKTPSEIVSALWGMVGITATWRDGVLEVRGPDIPGGDMVLGAPFETESWETVVLDDPSSITVTGDDSPTTNTPDPNNPDDPEDPKNSPDPHERDHPYPPGTPTKAPTPSVIDARSSGVTLGWPRAVDATQYILERADGGSPTSSGIGVWKTISIGFELRVVDNTVVQEATYSYRLTVNGQTGYTTPSDPVSVTVPKEDADGVPYPPENLQTILVTDTTAQIAWDQPRADPLDAPHPRHGEAAAWIVEWVNEADAGDAGNLVVGDLAAELQGLRLGSTYTVSITATNSAGASTTAAFAEAFTTEGGPPPEVTDLAAGIAGPTSVPLTFTAVQGATDYQIQVAIVPDGLSTLTAADFAGTGVGFGWNDNASVPLPKWFEGGQIDAYARNLTPSTRYVLRVRGQAPGGDGPWSEAVEGATSMPVPGAPPDSALVSFERDGSVTLTFSHPTDDGGYVTTKVNKLGGRLNWERETVGGVYYEVPGANGDLSISTVKPEGGGFRSVLYTASKRETRYAYDIAGWPETLTGSVTQAVTYRIEKRETKDATYIEVVEAGREQQKVHQEWSPQGWMNREVSRSSSVTGFQDINTTPNAAEPTIDTVPLYGLTVTTRTHAPLGFGQWMHTTSTTIDQDVAVKDEAGDVTRIVRTTTMTRPPPTIDDQAAPQATMPSYTRRRRNGRFVAPPPLERNTSEGSLEPYTIGEDWFVVPKLDAEAPGVTGSGGGSGGDGPTTSGSGDPSGRSGPDISPPVGRTVPRGTTVPGTGQGPAISVSIPWVRDPDALERYAKMAAAAYGPRRRITRTYFVPVNPAVGGSVKSVQADLSGNSITVSVMTEVKA